MLEFWGLASICEAMSWRSQSTPIRQMKANGFLMFRRRRGKHPRIYWYTNSSLISSWQVAMCKADREQLLERDKQRGKLDE